MRRSRYVAILALASLPFLPLEGQEPFLEDPVPIRRVLIPAARVRAELERPGRGVLVPMPREKFEALVQKAARAKKAEGRPRLVKARYAAVVEDNALVNGSGKWTVLNPAGLGVLPLPSLNLAFTRALMPDGKEAVLGALDGKTPGVLFKGAGSQEVVFDWNLRGAAGANGIHYDLRLPACAMAILELKVPPDQIVTTTAAGVLLSGPQESESPRWRLWQLHFAGRERVEFVVRRKNAPGAAPVLLAGVKDRQWLSPGRCRAEYDFHIDVLHGSIDRLLFDCDPGLEPYEVLLPSGNLKGWEIQEPAAEALKKGPVGKVLAINMREPFQGTLSGLRIRCLRPQTGDGPWTSPAVRLRQAVTLDETLKISVDPLVRLENWSAGQFRLVQTGNDGDGSQALLLLGPGARDTVRPSAAIRTHGVDLLVRQQASWAITGKDMTLTAALGLEIRRGKLFHFSVQVPSGSWQVMDVQFARELTGTWHRAGDKLHVDLAQPLTPATRPSMRDIASSPPADKVPGANQVFVGEELAKPAAGVTIRLHAPLPGTRSAGTTVLDFPDIAVVEPCVRTGSLSISVDPSFEPGILQSSATAVPADEPGPRPAGSVDYSFPILNQPRSGKLRLLRRPAHVRARVHTEVTLGASATRWQVRLELEPVRGSPDTIELYSSAPLPDRLPWKSENNLVRSMERLPALEVTPRLLTLGKLHPLTILGLETLVPDGQRWRLRLNRPLQRRETLLLEISLGPGKNGTPRPIPLLTVLNADRRGTDVSVQAVDVEIVGATTRGLRNVDAREDAAVVSAPVRSNLGSLLHYAAEGPFPELVISTKPGQIEAALKEACLGAELTTFVEPEGRLLHHFRFRIADWNKENLTVLLPAHVQVIGARVDNRWIGRIDQQAAADGHQVHVPVPASGRVHDFALVYATDTGVTNWFGWASVRAPAPQLPVPPMSFRRTWRMPPELKPLDQTAVRCLSGPEDELVPGLEPLRTAWHAGDAWLAAVLGVSFGGEWQPSQRQNMMAAEHAWRLKNTRGWLLGGALERLAFVHLRDQPLVIDAAAFRAARLEPSSRFPALKKPARGEESAPFWESAGVVYVPCPAAALLSTRGEPEKWDTAPPYRGFAERFGSAVAEAAAHGQDGSGRFQTVDMWLLSSAGKIASSPVDDMLRDYPGWTDWQPSAANRQPAQLTVINEHSVKLIGIGAALLALLAGWRIGRRLSSRWRFPLLLAWLTLSGLAILWAPASLGPALSWIFAAGFVLLLVCYARALSVRKPHPAPSGKVSSQKLLQATAGAIAFVLFTRMIGFPVRGGGAAAADVLIVQGTPAAGEQQTALVPPALLKRLDELVGPMASERSGAVLVSARYRGTVNGRRADFKAEFDFCTFAEQTTLFVPLEGVDLNEESFLDGRPVYPVAAVPPRTGYALALSAQDQLAPGFHRLTLTFSVRVPGTASERELRFDVPRLMQSHLELSLADSLQAVQGLSGAGAQRLTRADKRQNLEVDLGRDGLVQVRWRVGAARPAAPRLRVREAYLWDLRAPLPGLTGVLQGSVVSGELMKLEMSLPQELEIRSVELLTAGPGASAGIKSWRVHTAGPDRRLEIEFLTPISGDFRLRLGLVPLLSILPGSVNLPLPLLLNVRAEDFGEGLLAYRLEGLEARESPQNLAVVVVSAELFAKSWRELDARSAMRPTRAFSFKRNAPRAALGLYIASASPVARQEIGWGVHPAHAELSARCELASDTESLMLIEWQVPASVFVTGVRGAHIRQWTRHGDLLQIWLDEPQKEAKVEVTGWVRNAQPLAATGRFELPPVSLRQAGPAMIRVQAGPGITLRLMGAQNLTRVDKVSPALLFTSPQPQKAVASFEISHALVKPDVSILTMATLDRQALAITALLDYRVPIGDLRQTAIELRGFAGDDVKLDALGIAVQVSHQRLAGGHIWHVKLPHGAPRRFSFRVSARALVGAGRFVMPDIAVAETGHLERTVAVVGKALQAEPGRGVQALKNSVADLPSWPKEARDIARSGGAWRVTDSDWQLGLSLRPAAVTPAVRVLLCEQEAALADRQRWLHQATFLLFARRGADLDVTLPRGARLLAVALDGTQSAATQSSPDQVRLPLTGPAGARTLRLRWMYDQQEKLLEPNLSTPVIKGTKQIPVTGLILVPAGFEGEQRLSSAEWLYRRATAQLQLCKLLAERPRDSSPSADADLLNAQQRFFWYCRQTEHAAARSANAPRWAEKVSMVRKQNEAAARQFGFERSKTLAEQKPLAAEPLADDSTFALPAGGRPIYWSQDGAAAPPLPLLSHAGERLEFSRLASEVLLLLVVGIAILSCLPRTWLWLRVVRPEQVLALGCLGWYLLGGSLVGIVLIGAAVTARLVLTVRWVQRMVQRPTASAAGSSFSR